jgi:hypothetical protein
MKNTNDFNSPLMLGEINEMAGLAQTKKTRSNESNPLCLQLACNWVGNGGLNV